MGMFIILISFFIQTGYVSFHSVLVSTPIAILVGAILLSNSIRDIEEDTEAGRRTLAILLGKKNAIYFLAGMFATSYVWVVALIITGILTPWALIVFFSVAYPKKAVSVFHSKHTPKEMGPAMKATAQTNKIFGLLLALGLLIGYFL